MSPGKTRPEPSDDIVEAVVVKTLAELDGIAIQAIAIDAMDRVYAATSPDGKVYRVGTAGQVEVFYDPQAKYIWAMAFDKGGNLYVATVSYTHLDRYELLPERARSYLEFLEARTGVEIGGVSTGPERNETMIRAGSKLERLLESRSE